MKRRNFFAAIGAGIAGITAAPAIKAPEWGPWVDVYCTWKYMGSAEWLRRHFIEVQKACPGSVYSLNGQMLFVVYDTAGRITNQIMYRHREKLRQ